MVKIGLVGTGMLGEAVGLHLLESGHSLTAYNRTKSKTSNLEKNGAIISDTPKNVAESSNWLSHVSRMLTPLSKSCLVRMG